MPGGSVPSHLHRLLVPPFDLHGEHRPAGPDPGPLCPGLLAQQKIRKATRLLGEKTYQALERGEANPLVAPEVSEAVQKAKDLKDLKDKNYRVIAAIREQIRCSCAIATPEEPGDVEDNPPQS